jgi:hypothetical protein
MRIHGGIVQMIALLAFLAGVVLVPWVRKALLCYIGFLAYEVAVGALGYLIADHFWGFDARGPGTIAGLIVAFMAFYKWGGHLFIRDKPAKPTP